MTRIRQIYADFFDLGGKIRVNPLNPLNPRSIGLHNGTRMTRIRQIYVDFFDLGGKIRVNPLNPCYPRSILLLIIFDFQFSIVNSQSDSAYISVTMRVQKDAVLLRWAASTPMAWKETNKYGFDIVRYTLVRDGDVLAQAEMKKLNQSPFKAPPVNEWEAIVQTNDFAAIIAQALFGENFELSGGDNQGIAKIINTAKELEQRFVVSLYAADQNFEAACMAAWGWKDTDVKPNERYLYRVIPVMSEKNPEEIQQGAVFVAMDEYEVLPKPMGLTGIFGDKNVMLVWDYISLNDIYNSYYIEKSADGRNFTRMDGVPVTNLNSKDDRPAQRMYFVDSLVNNTGKYYYRVVGVTPFGEIGPPSQIISGQGSEVLAFTPFIRYGTINEAGNLELEWEFDKQGNSLIKGFELKRADKADGDYEIVVPDIAPVNRSLLIGKDKLNTSNYFVMTAIPVDGLPVESFPFLVQPVDSIPPAIPTGFKGSVDTSGIVTLTWNKNTESDLLGYKVYRAQIKNEEAIALFDIAWRDTVYRDTIVVKNLNRKVYYALASLDHRYNQSDPTALLELEKPDIIPPSSPVISNYRITDAGIEISWINSTDADVVQHRVWRREKTIGYSLPTLLKTVTDTAIVNYVDTTAVTNQKYVYTVTALKKNYLESRPSNGLTAFTNKPKLRNTEIERFDAIVDKTNRMLKLTWVDKLSDVQYYEVYKGEGTGGTTPTPPEEGNPDPDTVKEGNTTPAPPEEGNAASPTLSKEGNISLWKTLPAGQYEILDEELISNTTYQYIIRAILKSGKNTKSKSLTIKY
jgi:fibronectin type 3 domain-containing protein